jgi:hypothetical protein
MAALFLPFTPNGKATELLAIDVKRRVGIPPDAAVDPLAILPRVPARLVEPRELWERCPRVARVLFVDEVDCWSGIGYGESPADGVSMILLNPLHALTRRRATLMEEIVHIVRIHPKSTIVIGSGPVAPTRSYDRDREDEAFTVGAACLLPYPELFRAIRDSHETGQSIAERFGVSLQYVEFRIKRAGLARIYNKHSGRTARRSIIPVR